MTGLDRRAQAPAARLAGLLMSGLECRAQARARTVAACLGSRHRARCGTVNDQRRSPRVKLELPCTLHRPTGSPITGRTVDVGPGGMCVCTSRPLAADEVLTFELSSLIGGRARVLRQQGHDMYAIRFELLGEPARAELHRLATTSA
jgi:PilZ domain